MATKIVLLQFSNPDIEENEIQTYVFSADISYKDFNKKLKKILENYYKDYFDKDEFKKYWEESDFESNTTLDGNWEDIDGNPFFTKIIDVIK